MADTLKLLYTTSANRSPGAATLTAIYTVTAPASSAMLSRILVANRSATATAFRVALLPNGVAVGGVLNEHYIAFDVPIAGNDTVELTVGAGLELGVTIAVYATLATLTFNACGIEVS